MKKRFLVSAMAFFMALSLYPFLSMGQNNYEDVVYLKSGGIMHGMIIEQVPNVSLKIQTADRNVFVYKIEEIEKITKEPVPGTQVNVQTNAPVDVQPGIQKEAEGKPSKPGIDHIKQKGFTVIPELNMNRFDFANEGVILATTLKCSAGYLVNPHFSVGGGTGFELLDESCYIPFYGALRYNISKQAVSPYISADVGWASRISNNDYSRGGFMVNAAFGVKFFVSNKTALTISLGYQYQEYRYQSYYYPDYYYYGCAPTYYWDKGAYKMFNFNFGVTI
jgi:hypothetical protein